MDDLIPLIPWTSFASLTFGCPFRRVSVWQKFVSSENLGKNKVIELGVIQLVRT